MQDGGSQLIGLMMSVTPGMRVIDACAGAGELKTLQLAAMMENKGQVIAMDRSGNWKNSKNVRVEEGFAILIADQ